MCIQQAAMVKNLIALSRRGEIIVYEHIYFSFIQDKKLTSYRFVTDPSQTNLKRLIGGSLKLISGVKAASKSNLRDAYFRDSMLIECEVCLCVIHPSLPLVRD